MPILTPEERIGTRIADKYRLESLLGRGGMGVIFRGVHELTERRVAVKILHHHYASDERVAKRFLNEARSTARLKHPNVVDVLDMGFDRDGTVYLALELLDGESLADRYHEVEGGRMPVGDLLTLLLPVMDALAMAHDRLIVHRDLKPDNIFLHRSPRGLVVPKLLDFGIVKVLDSKEAMTHTGTLVGTPHYMAPEQARGAAEIGPAVDVWSMGVVLYEGLTGGYPIDGPNTAAVLASVIGADPPRLVDVAPYVPPAIARCVDRALTPELTERHRNMTELARDIREAAQTEGVEVATAPIPGEVPVEDQSQKVTLPGPGSPESRRIDSRLSTRPHEPKRAAVDEVAPAGRRRWPLLAVATAGIVAVVVAAVVSLQSRDDAPDVAPSPEAEVSVVLEEVPPLEDAPLAETPSTELVSERLPLEATSAMEETEPAEPTAMRRRTGSRMTMRPPPEETESMEQASMERRGINDSLILR